MSENSQAVGTPVEPSVRPIQETARPLAWMSKEGLTELRSCNGVSVWCESAALYEHPAEAHPSLTPVYDLSVAEAWRAFGLHAERERSRLQAESERLRAAAADVVRVWSSPSWNWSHAGSAADAMNALVAALGPNVEVTG